jgi:hypothetical protein
LYAITVAETPYPTIPTVFPNLPSIEPKAFNRGAAACKKMKSLLQMYALTAIKYDPQLILIL